eukprot:10558416-Lingulodinium_polyedra.AAC.1
MERGSWFVWCSRGWGERPWGQEAELAFVSIDLANAYGRQLSGEALRGLQQQSHSLVAVQVAQWQTARQ